MSACVSPPQPERVPHRRGGGEHRAGGVDGVAALLEDRRAGRGRERFAGDRHPVAAVQDGLRRALRQRAVESTPKIATRASRPAVPTYPLNMRIEVLPSPPARAARSATSYGTGGPSGPGFGVRDWDSSAQPLACPERRLTHTRVEGPLASRLSPSPSPIPYPLRPVPRGWYHGRPLVSWGGHPNSQSWPRPHRRLDGKGVS